MIAAFVARLALYERILADVAAEKPNKRPQHHLIVGQRGMGKSLLLARLAAELRTSAKFSQGFVPLVFAEEQYAVDRLSKFWLNCLDSLADAAERGGDTAASDHIDVVVRGLKPRSLGTGEKDELAARAALDAFLNAATTGGRRPVLLVDNLQLVFERITKVEQHALRELLMRPGSPILVGATPSPPPESREYDAAFYDHFKVHYLRPLSSVEMRELILKLADITRRPDVRDKVLAHPERLKALRDLTGGNPRTVVTLFFLYAEDFSPSVFADLENLLDRVTPLYKARIEELAEQQQVVVSAVADAWRPITARGLSEATGLPMANISGQLDRLEKTGFVEKVEIFGDTATGYQIAERFFNVWFLMRSASRRQRREVEFLVRFLEGFYEVADRRRLAAHLMKERRFSADRYQFARALSYTLDREDGEELTRHAELAALREKALEARRELEEVIDFSSLPPATLAFHELREKLAALVPDGLGVTPERFTEEVLGSREMFIRGERERLAATRRKLNRKTIRAVLESIDTARKQDESRYGKNSVAWFDQQLATGQLRAMGDLDDWNRLFVKASGRDSVQLMVDTIDRVIASTLRDDVRLQILNWLAPPSGSTPRKWCQWGFELASKLGWHAEAERAFRKAIEIDSSDAAGWDNLGNLLRIYLGRYEEAEAAYRKAIEIDPDNAWPWGNLGDLLRIHLGRYEEAEAAYRKAIEIDPDDAWPWNGLGDLLRRHLGRYEEAEAAYRRAIELDPEEASHWNDLGNLLRDHLGRYEESEVAYRKAIELDPRNAWPWNGLGGLLRRHLGRYEESEAAYRKAIELDPRNAWPWNNLGDLLRDDLGRYEESEAAYRKAIEIDPRTATYWNGLGDLYCGPYRRYSDAASAYESALAIDDSNLRARNNLVFLHRDLLGDQQSANRIFSSEPPASFFAEDTFYLHEALFAAYDANWGTCKQALAKAIDVIDHGFPANSIDDWFRASAVLLHLNYGEELIAFLRERGDDVRLRPWFEALSALHQGDRRYLENIPVEVRATAEHYFDHIDKRLSALPEKTRRRPMRKLAKKRRKP
ncbi:MAG: tetratricopeptide repeat protein [Isosphaeraceae bacterium]|nr:tetratricopeptide repeat protein [Isosphaeraceae bacterium]